MRWGKGGARQRVDAQAVPFQEVSMRPERVNELVLEAECRQPAPGARLPRNLLDLSTEAAVGRVLLDDDDSGKFLQAARFPRDRAA